MHSIFTWWLVAGLISCSGNQHRATVVLPDDEVDTQRDLKTAITQELLADMYDLYERDEPPEVGNTVLGVAGTVRIGVRPGDLLVDDELRGAPSRWPLLADPAGVAKSKFLRVQLAADLSSAWVTDEISWRATVCNRFAVLPLRFTAMFARDGDRWINVFEHLSYGHEVVGTPDGALRGKSLAAAVASRDISDALSRVLAPVLAGRWGPKPAQSVAIGPRWNDEWQGAVVGAAPLSPVALISENRRVGVVGRDVEKATTAYWVGTFIATVDGKKVRLRGSFVFEKYDAQWQLMQSHVSVPVDDEELAARIFGTGIESLNPLRLNCDIK
jgi:hypothetical protein